MQRDDVSKRLPQKGDFTILRIKLDICRKQILLRSFILTYPPQKVMQHASRGLFALAEPLILFCT